MREILGEGVGFVELMGSWRGVGWGCDGERDEENCYAEDNHGCKLFESVL